MRSSTLTKPTNENSTTLSPMFGKRQSSKSFYQGPADETCCVSNTDFGHNFGDIQVVGSSFTQSCPLALSGPTYCPFGGACHTCPVRVQTKLKINEPDDKYEQEADRIADEVMRMPEPKTQKYPDVEKEDLQIKNNSRVKSEAKPNLTSRIHALKGDGQPLPESTRAFFESRFCKDLSQVRVHSDARVAETAKALNAHAFTIGKDIIFRNGECSPESNEGRKLLAHELTHIFQQSNDSSLLGLQRKESASPGITFDLEFDFEMILGPKPKEESIAFDQDRLLELYQYLKYIRKYAPELEQLAKCILEIYFPDYGEEVWEMSKNPFAGYVGTRYQSKERMKAAQRLGLEKTGKGGWVKKFLGSDVIFFSGHHYGSGELDYLNITDLKIRKRPAKFERVKLIMISSCNVLNKSNLPTWRRRFPNAYILGWYGSAPYRQSNMMMKFLSKLPEDLILDDQSDMEKVLKLWEAFIENLEDEDIKLLTSEKRKSSKWGLGYATPDGTIKYIGKNRRGDWIWITKGKGS